MKTSISKRTKKIVAVILEDGTKLPVSDADLIRYLETREVEAACDGTLGINPSELKEMTDALAKLKIEVRCETNSKNAAQPRNEFAKREDAKSVLLTFKDEYMKMGERERGWKKVACERFLIDPNTLNDILGRP